jgi:3-oxoacyl-[acyl-carrier-protein] synthase III
MSSTWLMMEHSPNGQRAPHVARLESVGRCLPRTRRTTAELMASTRHRTRIDLERLTGIRERRVSDGHEDSRTLAVGAAADCLSRSRHRPEDLDVVVSCSITKYRDDLVSWLEPPMSVAVAQAIGATNAVPFDVSNACAGMLTGVFAVANRIRRGEIRCGMVVSGEYISHLGVNAAAHVRSILSRELASLTLGDAGAAVILERAPEGTSGIDVAGFTTVSQHSELCVAYPARHDRGGRMFTKARALHQAAIADMPFLFKEALDAAGLEIGDIDHVIPHQTSARAIRKGMGKVVEALGEAPRTRAVVTVDRYGNTASTTHFVALVEELRAGRLHPGDRVALVALASGLEIGMVLFTVDEELVRTHGNHD